VKKLSLTDVVDKEEVSGELKKEARKTNYQEELRTYE